MLLVLNNGVIFPLSTVYSIPALLIRAVVRENETAAIDRIQRLHPFHDR